MRRFSVLSGFLALMIGLTLVSTPTSAQTNKSAGITVSPVTLELGEVTPGDTKLSTVRVINPGNDVVTLYPQVLNFTTDNEDGRPAFYSLKDKNSRYALSEWITFSKKVLKISPNEEEQFELTVKVPLNAEPGGKYGAILFSTEEPKLDQDVSQIGVVGMTGTLILARVPGAVTERLVLEEFDAPEFIVNPPAKFSLLFNNVGNVHLRPSGEIKIRNMFGNTVATLKVNEAGGAILPESRRRFDADNNNLKWSFDWKTMGKFTATTALTTGTETMPQAVRTFYIIPLWLILTIFGLILILAIWIIRRKRRRYRDYDEQRPIRKPKPVAPVKTAPPVGAPPVQAPSNPEKKRFVMR